MIDNEFLLFDRLQKIKSVVNQYGEEKFYISFSGGKDSTVLSELVDMALPDNKIPRVYANTGVELNMIRNFVLDKAKIDDRFVVLKPSVPIQTMLKSEGYPFKSKEHSQVLDIYQRNGMGGKTVPRYLEAREDYGNRYRCPKMLEYQFTKDFKLRISDKCCVKMKEKPLATWAKEHHKPCRMLGIMPSEGGRRATTKCLAFKNGGEIVSFHPLSVVSKDWEDWFISAHNVKICDIYNAPYNFDRTGCKGCPFNIYLQHELDILEEYFPAERKQCEIIWKPVYDEYRRLGYRLKNNLNK